MIYTGFKRLKTLEKQGDRGYNCFMAYWVFGSKSSQDVDMLAVVPSLGSIAENKLVVSQIESDLQSKFSKELNVNLGVLTNGVLSEVFKGTIDEVNNSIFDTYHLHDQNSDLLIDRKLPRDVDLKTLRCLRVMLSFYSRTAHRAEVKQALSGDVVLKHKILSSLDISVLTDLGAGKNINFVDYLKTMAFQMGQTHALRSGVELYTKESIGLTYPKLDAFLKRQPGKLAILEDFKKDFLASFDPMSLKYQYEEFKK